VSLAKTGPGHDRETTDVKLKTFGLALVATAFMASSSLAAMQPIPNPPEKAKVKHHKAKAKAKPAADAAAAKPADAATPAKPAMPAKK
jgi:hypothetical protein